MRGAAAGVAAALFLGGCTQGGGSTEQNRASVAQAIKSADDAGVHVDFTHTLVLTGGDIPSGKEVKVGFKGSGTLKGGNGQLRLSSIDAGGKAIHDFDLIVYSDTLYIRPRGAQAWASVPAGPATLLIDALRLRLLREAVLLSNQVGGGGLEHTSAGFGHSYTAAAAGDQVEQLLSTTVAGAEETAFLKSARATIDAHLGVPGDALNRLEIHASGPVGGLQVQIDSACDLKRATAPSVTAPATATPLPPAQLLDFFFA